MTIAALCHGMWHGAACVSWRINMTGKVIKMSEHKPIPPKSQTYEHQGQTYVCKFDPSAAENERWSWVVLYKRTYPYFGKAKSLQAACAQARRTIVRVSNRITEVEENE